MLARLRIAPEGLLNRGLDSFQEEHAIEEVAKLHYYHFKLKRISMRFFKLTLNRITVEN